ncbi:hypothetical protein K8I61_11080 [bacterium]|nr:hypothetical protein [bacterium]
MIGAGIECVDLDARHWRNLLALFARPRGRGKTMWLFVENDRCVKAWHPEKGALVGYAPRDVRDLEAIRAEQGVESVAVLAPQDVRAFFAAWQRAIARDDDYDAQILSIVAVVREFSREVVRWHPRPPKRIPDRVFDVERRERRFHKYWPDETCVGLFVFDGDRPHTSLILGKSAGKLSLMTTLDAFGLADGPFDYAAQWKQVADLCRRHFHPLHAALWIERSALGEMLAGRRRASYLRLAIERRRALIAPCPPWWGFALRVASWMGQ